MKKFLIIGGVVVIVLGAATGGYLVFFLGDNDQQDATGQTETTENAFNPVATEGVPVVATVTTTQDGETQTFVMEFDGNGNSQYEMDSDGQTIRFVTTKDAHYMCNDAQGCFRYPTSDAQQGAVDPGQYEYSQSDIDNFRANATHKGQQSCSTGTCDVWDVSNFQDSGTATVFIDTASKRIVKIESTFNGSTSTIEFDYRDVTIEIPTDAQELPAGI